MGSPTRFRALTADPAKAVELTGAIVNDEIPDRIDNARKLGEVVLDSAPIAHPAYPGAVVRTPMIVKVTDGYAQRVLRPGQLRGADRVHSGQHRHLPRARSVPRAR